MKTVSTFSDDEKSAKTLRRFGAAWQAWSGFAAFTLGVFWFLSSGDFSFLLTLSSLVSVFSFLWVFVSVIRQKSVSGVSLRMMECYAIIFLCRLCAIIPFESYLPLDKSGDWFYRACEGGGLLLSICIVDCCRSHYKNTYDADADTMNRLWILVPTAVVSLILHPNLNGSYWFDIAWAFALYLECVTVLPQLSMFVKLGKAQPHTAHFLVAQALSRLMSFIFWASSHSELSDPHHYIKKYVGYWVMMVQLLQLLIMGDFVYLYIRCVRKGIPMSQMFQCSDEV